MLIPKCPFSFCHFRVVGNPLICGPKASNNCSAVFPEPLSLPPDGMKGEFCCLEYLCISSSFLTKMNDLVVLLFGFEGQSDSGSNSHHVAIAFGASFGAAFSIIIVIGLFVWWRYRRNQ